MTIKYRISCFDSEILVKETKEDGTPAFQVSIQHAANPLGFGNVLASYATEDQAILQANQFCRFYTKAKEQGYYLQSDCFVKPDKRDIPVSDVLENCNSEEDINRLLEVQ
ncbi:hypothetical protein [Paenibacillus abyssi]|uniref:Uncharacterized protein n=1 Tax=Paenibacillus abyssi TaxID=1340531 RepID=A0A917FWB2_9BACL|nr:hypothetical protein [Paenibacillus abyssi]GGG09092.1 hypothetical protein GCM10010916_27400 [Paenibacillus abyssi]